MSVEYFERFFDEADTDKSGELSIDEVVKALRNAGFRKSDSELKQMFRASDSDCSGQINRQEFLEAMGVTDEKVLGGCKADRWAQMFKQSDTDGSGFMDREELAAFLSREVSEKEKDRLMALVDADGDGKVSQEEFLKLVRGY